MYTWGILCSNSYNMAWEKATKPTDYRNEAWAEKEAAQSAHECNFDSTNPTNQTETDLVTTLKEESDKSEKE